MDQPTPPPAPPPANAPVHPDAEFSLEIDGQALVISWLSEKTIAAALMADRATRVFLVEGRAGRTLGNILYTFEQVAEAYHNHAPEPAPPVGLAPAEDPQGVVARLFNAIWDPVVTAADAGATPVQCLQALAAGTARVLATIPGEENRDKTFRVFCGNLQHMAKAEVQSQARRRSMN